MGKKKNVQSTSASDVGGKAVEKAKKRRKIEPCAKMGGEKLEEELDEISLQLREERLKALEILDSMVTDKACGIESTRECEEGLAVCQAKKTKVKKRVKENEILDSPVEGRTENNERVIMCAEGQPKKKKVKRMKEIEGGLPDADRIPNKVANSESMAGQLKKEYTVNTDLRQLFSNPTGGGFSFLASEAEDSSVEDVEASPNPELQSKARVTEVAITVEDSEDGQDVPKYFFFHSGCETLRNRVDENSFYRSESFEELQHEWPTKRASMKQSFRRRHKDALKFGRKRGVY